MAKRRREKMSEGKKNIIADLIQEYDIKTAADIQEALKDLLGGTISKCHEKMGRKLGCYITDVQIFSGCEKSDVYYKCNRKPKQCTTSSE